MNTREAFKSFCERHGFHSGQVFNFEELYLAFVGGYTELGIPQIAAPNNKYPIYPPFPPHYPCPIDDKGLPYYEPLPKMYD